MVPIRELSNKKTGRWGPNNRIGLALARPPLGTILPTGLDLFARMAPPSSRSSAGCLVVRDDPRRQPLRCGVPLTPRRLPPARSGSRQQNQSPRARPSTTRHRASCRPSATQRGRPVFRGLELDPGCQADGARPDRRGAGERDVRPAQSRRDPERCVCGADKCVVVEQVLRISLEGEAAEIHPSA